MHKMQALTGAALLSALTVAAAHAQVFPSQIQEGGAPPAAQHSPAPQAEPLQPQTAGVVATVNDTAITQEELNAHLQRHLQARPEIDAQAASALQQQVLQMLIDSALVEEYLIEEGPEVPEVEVDAAVDQVKEQVESQGGNFDAFLNQQGQTEASMKRRVEGMLAWQKYQQQAITEPKLQEYFAQYRQHFGGQEYGQVRQQVIQSYASGLWKAIAEKARPEAKIEIVNHSGAAPTGLPSGGQYIPE